MSEQSDRANALTRIALKQAATRRADAGSAEPRADVLSDAQIAELLERSAEDATYRPRPRVA